MLRPRAGSAPGLAVLVLAFASAAIAQPKGEPKPEPTGEETETEPPPLPESPLAKYFTELARMKLVDPESGNKETLTAELATAEGLLGQGSYSEAAVALYAIIETPRYEAFRDFVEYQNAEYDLAVSLQRSGAQGASLDMIERILRRGPKAPYWGPAHRRAIDIALDSRDYAGILARLEGIKTTETLPVGAAGERAYLSGRVLYEAGKLAEAETQLATISRKSRLYSSAVYFRGVIRARRGEWKQSAEAMCEVAQTPDDDKFTFVVDERYFTIKDLARLGLGRIAHEQNEYDDAYYHYFQIPEDSDRLSEALFEASWSMYQKRELPTSRDLVRELLKEFPTSPMWPEAGLLAGYTDLADCKFDEAQLWYDQLIAKLQPIVDEVRRIQADPNRRGDLFARALSRWREVQDTGKLDGKVVGTARADTATDEVLALLRIDPEFVRLNDAVVGIDRAVGEAPGVVRQWKGLARRVGETKVGAISTEASLEQEAAADASMTVDDLTHLAEDVQRAKVELARGRQAGTIPKDVAEEEDKRLDKLEQKVADARGRAQQAADAAVDAATEKAAPGLRPLLQADVSNARRVERTARNLRTKLHKAIDDLAMAALERLHADTRRVLDKAKLGKIDAVIGQKRVLDIQVQDLAAGRFPAELIGRLWNSGMIGDDEEFWPFEGEYWADEYEGWR